MVKEYYNYDEAIEIVEEFMISNNINSICKNICKGKCCHPCYQFINNEAVLVQGAEPCFLFNDQRLPCIIFLCSELCHAIFSDDERENYYRSHGIIINIIRKISYNNRLGNIYSKRMPERYRNMVKIPHSALEFFIYNKGFFRNRVLDFTILYRKLLEGDKRMPLSKIKLELQKQLNKREGRHVNKKISRNKKETTM